MQTVVKNTAKKREKALIFLGLYDILEMSKDKDKKGKQNEKNVENLAGEKVISSHKLQIEIT